MSNLYANPWSTPVTNHSWFVTPGDDNRDYTLTRKYRQSIIDRCFIVGTKNSPTWAWWGYPAIMAGLQSYHIVGTCYKPWWKYFHVFPIMYFTNSILIRAVKESFVEYQVHKLLTWGQFEISSAKRRLAGAKESPVNVAEARTPGDIDGMGSILGGGVLQPPTARLGTFF
eukprot:TRINITY_DN43136_c0_g1_i1.p1 TRINITY_DN43136_c0_g1~~TRINITY_DN43136_c0_g1_i1.p1  ORF type:complete len:170 (+),score=13.82 TRINITY_DN43136_c0_g1_i1:162-671(+)